ncbi:MAG: SusC/RagA family TonB-linked outer membrane protein [Saprospiraceae bacterium]|nr:SusC/RagA family TonB-linked outer membrane protein [Saprospiraceae bacterium]
MKPFSILLLFLLAAYGTDAQKITVRGTVTDQQLGEAMPGVRITEKGSVNGAVTDARGQYSLELADASAVLVCSYLGYVGQEIPVGTLRTIDFALLPQNLRLGEIVVTALGLERSTKDLGYAVQRLDGSDISEVKSVNFTDNLAGKVAGVTISQGATGVGSTSKITIRGEASFSNNNPLFVVDGIPINNNSIINFNNDDAAGFQAVDFGNGAMDLNSDDVASVTVLKGPSAAALYGARASNGVILLSTKDGAGGQGLGVSFNSSLFVEQAFQLPQFQNQYGQGNSGKFAFVDGLGGGVNDNISYSWGPELNQGILVPQYDSPVTLPDGRVVRGGDVAVHGGAPIPPTPFVNYPDNLNHFYQTGLTTINNLAVSSGFEKGNFRLSLSDLRSKSIIPGVNLDRKTVAARFTFKPVKRLRIRSSINYINTQSDNRPANGYGSENTNYALVAWGPRSLDIENMKNYWQPGLEGLQHYSFNYTFFDNPYFTLLENRNGLQRDRLIGNLAATYDLAEHLSLTLRSGMDYSNEDRSFRRAFSSNRFKTGAYAEQGVFFRENNTDVLLNYTNTWKAFRLDLSAGANRLDQRAANRQTQASSLAQAGVFNLSNAAAPLEIFAFDARKRINSLYGIAKLAYQDFLYVDLTARNDWSRALATPSSTDNTSFFYPSVSAGMILSNVWQLPASGSFAKLRASVAQVGNDTDPFQTAGVFSSSVPYNSQPTFTAQSTIANANLLPERSTAYEIGADIRFWDDRLRIDLSYYDEVTENQIISLPIAISSGYKQQVVNGGAVRSRGLEIVAGLSPLRKSGFQWDVQFNFSRNVSAVESLPEGSGRLTLAYSRVYDNVNQTVWFQVEEGGKIGDMYGTGYKKNAEGQFVLNAGGNYIVDNTLKRLGNYNPDFILGFQNQFRLKNWRLGFLFDWRQGGILVSRTLALAAVGGQLIETANRPAEGIVAQGVVNTGTDENPVYSPNTKAISAESYYRQYYDRNHEENNTYDASYLKLREFSLGYTFPAGRLLRDGRSLSLAFVGRNLFAISHMPHIDPEQLALQGSKFVSGVEDMSYATSRSLGLKLGLNF